MSNWQRWGFGMALALGVVFVAIGLGVSFLPGKTKEPEVEIISNQASPHDSISGVVVDIGGAVRAPGVYRLEPGSRIIDLIRRAGDLSAEADTQWLAKNLNQAQLLVDGMKIYIPREEEKVDSGQVAGAVSGRINLNTATAKDLETLPGIGPSFAERIIEYRQAHQGFKSIEEIKLVPGIGDKIFDKIKDKIII